MMAYGYHTGLYGRCLIGGLPMSVLPSEVFGMSNGDYQLVSLGTGGEPRK